MAHIQISGAGAGGADEGTFSCLAGVAVRDVVYVSAANTVAKAQANAAGTMPAIGFVSAKPNATTATVRFSGELDGFAGLTPNATYYVSASSAGSITATAPSTHAVDFQQAVGVAKDADTLLIDVDRDLVAM